MQKRSAGRTKQRRRTQQRFYQLRGIVHCATGHNPLRMQGKTRKNNTYYTCGYRLSYGDKAAEALGHGKWQYVREDELLAVIDRFFATRIFGAQRLAAFHSQHDALARQLDGTQAAERRRLEHQRANLAQRLERQLAAIEAGVDPALVGQRIAQIKTERNAADAALAELDLDERRQGAIDIDAASEVIDALPDLTKPFATADPELRHALYDAFRLAVEIDRNASQYD